jgi:hypothetical protein
MSSINLLTSARLDFMITSDYFKGGNMPDFSSFTWSIGGIIVSLIVGLIGMLMYYIPTMVAAGKHHNSTLGIFLTNLLLGWTGIGWLVALIWALTNPRPAPPPMYAAPPPYRY